MIEINLLPGSRKKRGGKGGGFQMPDFKNMAGAIKEPWLIAVVIAWLAVAGLVAGLYLPRRAQVQGLEPRLAASQREARRMQAVLRTQHESQAKRDTLEQQIAVIRNIDRERYIWPHILESLSSGLTNTLGT